MKEPHLADKYAHSRRFSLQTVAPSDFQDLDFNSRFRGLPTPPTRSLSQRNWRKLYFLSQAIGAWILLLRDIRKYGVSAKTDLIAFQEEDEGKVAKSLFVLLPDAKFAKLWALSTGLLLIFSAFYVPYAVCLTDESSMEAVVIDYFIEAWFVTDIVLTFFTAYENKKGVIETSQAKIAQRYLRGWFAFDALACFPFQLFSISDSKSYSGLLRLLRLPRLYRLVRIVRLAKMMQNFSGSEVLERVMQEMKMHGGVLRLLRFSFMVVIIVHVAGCFWYFLAWMYDFEPGTWVMQAQMQDDATSRLYLVSIYYIFTVITTVGFGDIVAANSAERIYSILVMGFGIAFYSYTVSNISSVLSSMNQRDTAYKATVSALTDFAAETNLPKDLKDSVLNQVKHSYESNISSWYSKDKMMSELPAHLRAQVATILHKALVSELSFFADKDPAFISFVVPRLKSVTYTVGELLYQYGDYASEIFFLFKGEVILKDENGIGFKTYLKGSYFGEIEVLRLCVRECSSQVITLTAECLVLEKDQLREVMEEFPQVAHEIIAYAESREKRINDAKSFARLTLNANTKKRIAKKSAKSVAAGQVSWASIKQQFTIISLMEKRRPSYAAKTPPISPQPLHAKSSCEALRKESSSSRASSKCHLSSPTSETSAFAASLDRSTSQWTRSCEVMEASRTKKLLLPDIPVINEESFWLGSELHFDPAMDNTLREFERRDFAVKESLRLMLKRLQELSRLQKGLIERAREIDDRLI